MWGNSQVYHDSPLLLVEVGEVIGLPDTDWETSGDLRVKPVVRSQEKIQSML